MGRETLIYGFHAVMTAVRTHPENVLAVWTDRNRRDARMQALTEVLERCGITAQAVEPRALERKAGGVPHQGVVASYRPPAALGMADLPAVLKGADGPPLVLVLDGVTDPHNLGACLRSAEAAGARAVILPRDRAAGLTPAARKVASGAAERVPVVLVGNLAAALRELKAHGLWIYGLAGEGNRTIYEVRLDAPCALVAGAEGRGLRRLTREHCDALVNIPMAGRAESLNVSVASAVALFEASRQRHCLSR